MLTIIQVRGLAVFINASPQRRENFQNLQTGGPALLPIQDVRTRWNSTFLMLRRARRLRPVFENFCSEYNGTHQFRLNDEEWRQIEYLLYLTQPFFRFTTMLSKTRDVTVHTVFNIYNRLFTHFERCISQLKRKRVPWKQSMLSALEAGKNKLSFYYSKTEQMHGSYYAIATILAPTHKLQFFSSKEWGDNSQDWREIYRNTLQEYLEPYKQRLSDLKISSTYQSPTVHNSELHSFIAEDVSQRPIFGETDELERYLGSGMYNFYYTPIDC